MNMDDTSDAASKMVERISPATMGTVTLSRESGGLAFANMADVLQFAKVMAISGVAIPPHLRGQIGTCLAVTIQAVEWKLSPFAVANKSYEVNGRIAYESQLVQAVILQRAPIKGRFDVEFFGEDTKRQCTVTATLHDGERKSYTSPAIGTIKVQNSPLWKSDPDQQLFYYAGRALCRRHFPDVLLGIYTPDDIYNGPEYARDVTPRKPRKDLTEKLDELATGREIFVSAGGVRTKIDPQTGEIISQEEALADQTGEKAAALLAAQLDGIAASNLAPTQREDAGAAKPPEAAPASDTYLQKHTHLQKLIEEGRVAAASKQFKVWKARLNAGDYALVVPHLATIEKAIT
jgi:hypothetical protein